MPRRLFTSGMPIRASTAKHHHGKPRQRANSKELRTVAEISRVAPFAKYRLILGQDGAKSLNVIWRAAWWRCGKTDKLLAQMSRQHRFEQRPRGFGPGC